VTIILLILSAFYLYKFFYPTIAVKHNTTINTQNMMKEELPPIVITEDELPQSPQLQELAKLNNRPLPNNATDTLLISQTTETRKTPVVQQSSNINPKDIALIVQIIMSQINTKTEISLEEQLTNIGNKHFDTATLENSNHYNKIILSTENTQDELLENSQLVALTDELNSVLNEPITADITKDYSTSIKREVATRTNEMRVIIVQKGDTLSRIAKRAYGNYNAYPKIFSANPEVIKNPNQIFVGQRLRIPS
jgi:LysM repeat protein